MLSKTFAPTRQDLVVLFGGIVISSTLALLLRTSSSAHLLAGLVLALPFLLAALTGVAKTTTA